MQFKVRKGQQFAHNHGFVDVFTDTINIDIVSNEYLSSLNRCLNKNSVEVSVDFVDHTSIADDPLHQPNDGLFKIAFTEKETAIHSLQKYFPEGLSKHVQWQDLELQPANFVDERYQRSSSDLLYRVPIAGKDSFIYCLFEHWSTQDHWVALRLLKYQVRIWEQFLQQNPVAQKLPPIVPVVLAQHNKEWKVPQQFSELLEIPEQLKEPLHALIPNLTYRLIELAKIPYEEIQGTPTGILSLRVLRAASLKELMNDRVWDEEMFEQIPDEMIAAILAYIQIWPIFKTASPRLTTSPFRVKLGH